jgi:hypothetical protein
MFTFWYKNIKIQMNLGRYRLENYEINTGGSTQSRKRVVYTSNNGEDTLIETYNGYIRDGYRRENIADNLTFNNITTHEIGESLIIKDNSGNSLAYITLYNIENIRRESDKEITIIDNDIEDMTIGFINESECNKVFSAFNHLLENPENEFENIGIDTEAPIIFFNETFYEQPIHKQGSTDVGYWSTEDAPVFETSVNFSTFPGVIEKSNLMNLVFDISDDRDTSFEMLEEDILIYNSGGDEVDEINKTGVYSISFNVFDEAGNSVNTTLYLNVY